VLSLKRTETILPTKSGERCAVLKRGLAVHIERGGPPIRGTVFKFDPEGMKVVSGSLGCKRLNSDRRAETTVGGSFSARC